MVGKAKIFSDQNRESVYQKEADNEVYSAAAQQNSYNLGSTHFSDQSGIGNFAQAGSDQRKANLKGALFTGNIGFDLQTARLDVGTFTIDLNENGSGTVLSEISTDRIVVPSAGTTGDLETIVGSQRPGQRLFLYGIQGNIITIKNTAAATVNTIFTPGGVDFTLTDSEVVELVFDITTSKWRIVGGTSSGGGGGLTDPIILNENDLGTIGFIGQLIDWSTNNFYRAELNGDISITMENLPASGKWEQLILELTQDVVGGHAVTFTDIFANAVVPNINTGGSSKTAIAFYAYNDGVSPIILAFDTQSNFNAYPEVDLGTLGPAAVNIDWGAGNFQRMILSGDVIITHTNLPLPLQWQQVIVEYTQDLVGNHNVTYTQAFNNGVVPLVNFTPTSKTTVVFYAYNTGVITLVLAFETMSSGNTNFIHAIKAADQPPPLPITTHAEFDTVISNSGIVVSTGAGQLSGIFSGFRAGRIYECECFIGIRDAIASSLGYCFFDIALGLFVGSRGFVHTMDNPGLFQSAQPSAKVIFAPLLDTDTLEVQFTTNTNPPGIFMLGSLIGQPESYVVIKDIT